MSTYQRWSAHLPCGRCPDRGDTFGAALAVGKGQLSAQLLVLLGEVLDSLVGELESVLPGFVCRSSRRGRCGMHTSGSDPFDQVRLGVDPGARDGSSLGQCRDGDSGAAGLELAECGEGAQSGGLVF